MLITGGAISGYCAIGRRANATAPRITNTIDSTAAKIGRSMKKWEIFIVCAQALFLRGAGHGRLRRAGLRRYLDAGTCAHQAFDDDTVARLEPALDDAVAVVERAERDVFLRHRIVGLHHIDEF